MINTDTLQKLEFPKLLDVIAGFTHSDASRAEVLAITPLADPKEIGQRFGQVEEIRSLTRLGVPLRLAEFTDIFPVLEMVRPADALLNPIELQAFIDPFRILVVLSRQFGYRQDIPLLVELAGHVTGFPDILEALERTIDRDGGMLDTASRLLSEIRGKKRALTARIRKRLEEIVRERSVAIFLQDDFITQRSGRWVIPVRMDSKGMVPGVVHDVSNTGETAFMEPIEIIGLANELENLAAEEKGEQIRILREICGWLREDTAQIEEEFRLLVRLDLLNSIAGCADLLDAEVPIVAARHSLKLVQARHPLLLLMHREHAGAPVVPLDLQLGDTEADTGSPDRVMVITGPNTGGKTIAIKTAGLLTLMALAGIPVPAAGTSSFPLVSDLLVDIGDEQAIEKSLSTFSSHVSKIAAILRQADSRALILLDELGTGTEPIQGAALACAVLRELYERGPLVLATTHLTEIVGFVHRSEGMINAAMEFDRKTLLPLYKLKPGEPGESHAIETARRYGLPDHVIDYAQGLVGRVGSEFQALLAELKEQRQAYETRHAEIEAREAALTERERILEVRSAETEERRRSTLEKAWREAKELVQGARRELNLVLDEARREKRESAREQLRARERQVDQALRELSGESSLPLGEIVEGSRVGISSLGCDATVLKVDRRQGRLRVQAGNIEMDVPLDDVTPPAGKSQAGHRREPRAKGEEDGIAREINLIGQRVDEAMARLEPFLNQASLAGYAEVRVIHGVGTGALRRAVHEHLDGHPLVSGFRSGERFEGGMGVTVVTLG